MYGNTTPRFEPLVEKDQNSTGCNLLPSNNGTVSLAANWENIPETLILNGSIGFVFFILFWLMTKIAWLKPPVDGSNDNENLVSFLYGYRDPERWYVIPRFEFLRHSPRHHEHDLDCSKLYVPPRLPLANPIELLAFDSTELDDTKSADDSKHDDESASSATQQPRTTLIKPMLAAKTSSLKMVVAAANKGALQLKQAHLRAHNNDNQAAATKVTNASLAGKKLLPGASNAIKSSKSNPEFVSQPKSAKVGEAGQPLKAKSLAGPGSTGSLTRLSRSFFYPSILADEQLQASNLARQLNRFFSLFFRETDADIIYAKGIDAYEYLLFQRHLILIMLVANIFCLGIILPVNWYFGQKLESGNLIYASSFQRTTIKNVGYRSSYYWAHIVSSVLIVLITVIILNSYRNSIVTKNETQLARRTLLVGNIPIYQRNRAKLCEIFRDYFARCEIESIQFVYNTSRLEYYQMQLDCTMAAKEYCCQYKERHNNRDLMVKQTDVNEGQYCSGNCRLCSYLLVCCCYWPRETKQAGSLFYAKQERRYRDKIKKDCEKLIQEPSEYAFVTLRSNRQAKRVLQELTRLKNEVLRERYANLWDRSKRSGGSSSSSIAAARSDTANNLDSAAAGGGGGGGGTSSSRTRQLIKAVAANAKEILTSNDNAASDPLDPNNNPHVRSIRSPIASQLGAIHGAQPGESTNSMDGGHSKRSTADSLDGPLAWSVRYAPHPDNVEYYDILELSKTSKYTTALLHALMIIIFIFFTTPNVLLSALERWSVLQPEATKQMTGFQGLFINYFSILLQIIATAILPSLIVLISKQIPYEDTSSKNHSTMWKTYFFLVLMVIVMPSIGMSSAQALLSSNISPECLFPTDNGAYFVNYVLTSIFLSSMLELIKPVDIIFYYFILWTSRSRAEFEGGRQYIEREFSVSMQHTGVLLIFSVVMTYMISCPLIAPAGLLYLIVKHAIDHYHLFYTYFTKKVDKNLQRTIEIFVRVALLLMLFQTTVAIYINTGTSYFSLISQMVFWLTLAIFLFNCCFDCTSRAIAVSGKRAKHQRDFCACFYLPRVIGDLLRSDAIPESCISRKV